MAILFSLGPSFNRPYRRDIELRWTSNDQQTPWYHLTSKVPSTRPTASTGGSIINERLEKTRICGQMNAVCIIYMRRDLRKKSIDLNDSDNGKKF